MSSSLTSRTNYIHWLQDLLALFPGREAEAGGRAVRGFDIGTGASLIYPLLGAAIAGWEWVASDAAAEALAWAEKNRRSNPQHAARIRLRDARGAAGGAGGGPAGVLAGVVAAAVDWPRSVDPAMRAVVLRSRRCKRRISGCS